ncbi:MAG: acetyl-coenzyme A synthetase N-terminal domain-containing protein, partial [Calditrichia bacterium]
MDKDKSTSFPFGQKTVWQPNPEWVEQSNLKKFMTRHNLSGYEALFQTSVREIDWFWNAVMQDLDIQFYQPFTKMVDLKDGIQFPRWCVDGKMNIIHNCLDKWQNTQAA